MITGLSLLNNKQAGVGVGDMFLFPPYLTLQWIVLRAHVGGASTQDQHTPQVVAPGSPFKLANRCLAPKTACRAQNGLKTMMYG